MIVLPCRFGNRWYWRCPHCHAFGYHDTETTASAAADAHTCEPR